jgi:hypothetical protein
MGERKGAHVRSRRFLRGARNGLDPGPDLPCALVAARGLAFQGAEDDLVQADVDEDLF